jgi:hypothetical protein
MMEGDSAINNSRNGNKSLIAVDNAEYSASIVDVSMSPCSLYDRLSTCDRVKHSQTVVQFTTAAKVSKKSTPSI